MENLNDSKRIKKLVILFYPRAAPHFKRGNVPLSLLAIAGPLEKAGYNVKIIDANVEKDYKEKILNHLDQALFIGISSMTGYQIHNGLEIAKLIKDYDSSIPVVWGGWHPSIAPNSTILSPFVDIVVRGQGEKTIVETADSLKNNRSLNGVLGVTYKNNGKIITNAERPFEDINNFPPLPYHLIDVEKYVLNTPEINSRTISYLSSRGCPYHCSFCAEALVSKRRWFGLKPSRVIKDLKFLINKYKINGVIFEDSNFFVDKERVRQICQGIIDAGLKVKWGNVNGRQDQLVMFEPELWQLLESSGLSSILVGAESGSQEILDILDKDSRVEYAIDLAKICSQYDIRVVYSLMTGFPGEPKKEFYKTLDLIDKILSNDHRHRFMLFFYTPYPGTPLFRLAIESGLKEPKTLEEWSKFNLNSRNVPWLSKKHAMKIEFISRYFFLLLHPTPGLKRLINKNFIIRNFYKIAYKIAFFRWNHRFFLFPLELFLLKFFKLIRSL
jgi:radical SAM superfamily enzyme YgiQ (UPF0313 family)